MNREGVRLDPDISPSPMKSMMLMLMSNECYDEFFYKLNFLNFLCLKALISKCLGLAIIGGSLIVKVPQIMKIWGNQSAQGVSFVSCLADLYAITIAASYSFVKAFPFSAYGEGLFIGAQTVTIASLVLYFNVSSFAAAAFSAIYAIICYVLSSGLTPIETLWSMQAISVPIMFCGKLVQAYANYKNQGTGQLSAATCILLLFGAAARVFTSIQETGDPIIILTYVLATTGNAIIVFQFIHYGKKTTKKTAKKKKN